MQIQTNDGKFWELFQRAVIPNSEGFKFIGIDIDGKKYRCEVVKGHLGNHKVEGMEFKDMIGWYN